MEIGNGGGDSGNPGEGQEQGGGGDFLAGLSEQHQGVAKANGWEGVGSVIDGYQSLSDKLAGSVDLPGEEATDEQRSEFYKTVSASWTPADGYGFAMPEGLDESFPYDADFAKEASDKFKEFGLHPSAAQGLHDWWVGKMADVHGATVADAEQRATKQAEAVENAHRELVKEYGEPGSDGYQNVVAKADRAMNGLAAQGVDVTGWFAEKGILSDADENGLQQVADPVAVKLLAFIHDRAFSEDGLSNNDNPGGGNPFDRKNPDMERQNELIRTKPDEARRLITAAGRDPKSFYL